MTCLSNAEIQAVADGEAAASAARHAAACQSCAARVRERERLVASMLGTLARDRGVPDHLKHRIEARLASGHVPGATRLRTGVPRPRRRAFWSAAFAAAATLAAVVFVAPLLKGPATVSASEILAASATRLQAPLRGVEEREYELVLDGVPKQLMPDHANGAYRIFQAIDHDTPGRFRFASFAPDGQPISSIAQEPLERRRVTMMVMDGQPYRFETSLPAELPISLPEIERLHMEASIAMMQASGNQLLQVVETAEGQQYRIEVRHAAAGGPSPVWDLTEARVVVDARDYRIREFAVTGAFLKQPYSVSYKLISQTVTSEVRPGLFDVPSLPGEVVFSGEGTAVPGRDAIVLAFRELSRLKQAR